VGEVDILGDGCSDGAWEVLNVSGDLEVVARSCVTVPNVSVGAVWDLCDVGSGHGKRVCRDGSANQRGTAIEIEQERGGRGEITVGVEYASELWYGVDRSSNSEAKESGLTRVGLEVSRSGRQELESRSSGSMPPVKTMG